MKSFTDIKQSNKLAEILPIESADHNYLRKVRNENAVDGEWNFFDTDYEIVPCWSLAALLSLIKDKCGYFEFVYLKRTSDGRANPLEDVYRLSTDVYDVYNKEAIDACVEMILKLHDLKML